MGKRTRGLGRIPVPAGVENALDSALDKALTIQRPVVQAYLDRLHRTPGITPAQAVAKLERHYLTAVMGIGGASGAAAAVPGAGTAASLASGAAEITAFVSASAMYVLALAELHQVPVSDPDMRRALVLGVLVGDGAEAALSGASTAGKHWAQVLARATSKDGDKTDNKAMDALNSRLGRMLVTRFGARQGALLFGRALPLGIGAGIGAAGNAALAKGAINAARKAFGPPPATFPPRIVDVGPGDRPAARR